MAPPPWLPVPVALVGLFLTLLGWHTLQSFETEQARVRVDREAAAVQSLLAARLDARWQALVDLAHNREVSDEPSGRLWRAAAAAYLQSLPGLQAIMVLDPEHRVRWVHPLAGNEAVIGVDVGTEEKRLRALERARATGALAVTPTVELRSGGLGFNSYAPVVRGGQVEGFVAGRFLYDQFFPEVLQDAAPGFAVGIREGGRTVHGPPAPAPSWVEERPLHLPGVTWTVQVWPTEATLQDLDTGLPETAGAVGLALTLLGTLLAFFYERASTRAREAREGAERYRDLVENIQELICTHDAEGKLLSVNRSLLRFFGYEREEEMVGRGIDEFLTPEARPGFGAYLEKVFAAGRDRGFMEVQTRSGAVRILEYDNSVRPGQGIVRGVSRDATERLQAEQEVRRLRRELQQILDSAQDGIVEVDCEGTIRFANPASARMIGRSPEELQGCPALEVLFAEPGPDCALQASLADGEPRRSEGERFRRRDGTAFPVEYEASPIRHPRRGVVGAALTFRDITERLEIDRMKDEFISVVSHELRTPLTSIRGSLGLLAGGVLGPLEPKGQRVLDLALANTERLVRLVNDILDLERLASGQAPLERAECRADDLVAQAVQSVQAAADEAGVPLEVQAAPATMSADPDRVVQALTNLLGNAVKFSEPGSPVRIRAQVDGEEVVFAVEDRGRGIPPDHLERIFDRFHQVDASDSRQKGGTGLGLAITRTIVQQHGGRLEVESEAGRGTTFRMVLPRSQVDPGAGPAEDPPDRSALDAECEPT